MSFDDYANHIYQKHRLAAALAVLKSKPVTENTEKYLKELKSKIDFKMDDDDVTVCSDDFLMEDDDINDSVNILKDFEPEFVNNDENLDGNADNEQQNAIPENLSQITYCKSLQTESSENILPSQDKHNISQKIIESESKNTLSNEFKDGVTIIDNKSSNSKQIIDQEIQDLTNKLVIHESMDLTYYDSQKTVIYTVPRFTQNYTHYSPSQDNIVIANNYIYGVNKNKNVNTGSDEHIREQNGGAAANLNGIESETQIDSKRNSLGSKTIEKSTYGDAFEYIPTMNMFSQNNDNNFDEIQNGNSQLDTKTKRTMKDMNIFPNTDKEIQNIQNLNPYSQNIDEYFDEIQIIDRNETINRVSDESNMNSKAIRDKEQITDAPFSYNKKIDIENRNTQNENDKTNINDTKAENSQLANDSSQNKVRREEYKITEEEYDTEEIISYKVLEEFNKIKSFLNRQRRMSCDGYSTDSGYRSDSQIRSSNRSALQLSGNWLNQSGCCLFNYIMQCPLVASSRDITNEIAQVLGKFIDRLHEKEKYPSFLEELLETVNILLRQVYEGDSSEEGEFLKKDENLQRILLLNKSIHIQKHSIEIITKILENFHSEITEIDSTYELINIDQIENITYIFHLLEILLKKYLKNREVLSQTQTSQEDEKLLKKSSITDIWRKKWNPSQENFEGSREKKCVLKFCSEILNKIVVDCVSCYSLVAYSALKCFNSMQT